MSAKTVKSELLTATQMAQKLAGGGVRPGIDPWAKALQEWLDSYIDRWKEEVRVLREANHASPRL